MAQEGGRNLDLRKLDGIIYKDIRKFYKFKSKEGQVIETKAASEQEARERIEEILNIELEEAA